MLVEGKSQLCDWLSTSTSVYKLVGVGVGLRSLDLSCKVFTSGTILSTQKLPNSFLEQGAMLFFQQLYMSGGGGGGSPVPQHPGQ